MEEREKLDVGFLGEEEEWWKRSRRMRWRGGKWEVERKSRQQTKRQRQLLPWLFPPWGRGCVLTGRQSTPRTSPTCCSPPALLQPPSAALPGGWGLLLQLVTPPGSVHLELRFLPSLAPDLCPVLLPPPISPEGKRRKGEKKQRIIAHKTVAQFP